MSIRASTVLFALAILPLSACAPKVPAELAIARLAFEHARTSEASTLAPAQLHVASEALDAAERAFEDDPRSFNTIDLAYVAQRKSQMAEAHAAVKRASNENTAASEALSDERATQLASSQGELAVSRGALAASEGELASSRERLAAAEQGRREAMAALTNLAAVREEERGLVITLSGGVLFTSGQSTLLPMARSKLDQVATALASVKGQPMVVEGHTDSQGTDSDNLALSQRRAEVVRSYLVERGSDPVLTTALGIGESRPVADNATSEGRANNRRVEIVVDHAGAH